MDALSLSFFTSLWPLGYVCDGAFSKPFVDCDVRVSPYQKNNAEIGRREPYTEDDFAVQTSALSREDCLALFEDGWRDCAAWLSNAELKAR